MSTRFRFVPSGKKLITFAYFHWIVYTACILVFTAIAAYLSSILGKSHSWSLISALTVSSLLMLSLYTFWSFRTGHDMERPRIVITTDFLDWIISPASMALGGGAAVFFVLLLTLFFASTVRLSNTGTRPVNRATEYYYRGVTHLGDGDFTRAVEAFTLAIDQDPSYVIAYHSRGEAYRELGELDKAVEDYTKAIELSPDFILAYFNRGEINQDKDNFEEAIKDFDKAISLNPEYFLAYL